MSSPHEIEVSGPVGIRIERESGEVLRLYVGRGDYLIIDTDPVWTNGHRQGNVISMTLEDTVNVKQG